MTPTREAISGEMAAAFATGALLTEYARQQPLKVENAVIDGAEVEHSKVANARFHNVTLFRVSFQNSAITDSVFEDTDIVKTDFRHTHLRNVEFRNVHFEVISFASARMENVRFVNCTFTGWLFEFVGLEDSSLLFQHSNLPKLDLYKAQVELRLEDSQVQETDMRGLKAPSSLTFINSEVKNADLSYSHLDYLKAKDSDIALTADNAVIKQVEFIGGRAAAGFARAQVESLVARDVAINVIGSREGEFGSILIADCHTDGHDPRIGFGGFPDTPKAIRFGTITLSNCNGVRFLLDHLVAQRVTLRDSHPAELDLAGSVIDELDLANLTVSGSAKTDQAQVKAYRRHKVKPAPGLHYSHTGANFTLFGPDSDDALKTDRR